MSTTSFSVDLRDLHFVLFDQLAAHEQLAAIPRFADLDREVYEATLAEGERLAREVLSPINAPGDLEGCSFDGQGNVKTPRGYREAWEVLREGGWLAPSAPSELGGGGLPFTIHMCLSEMLCGACMAFMMYAGLTVGAARVILGHGPADTREMIARKMFTGEWGGTMCLTEAGAGSSVGDNRCRATPTDEPGVYLLEGEKIFISGGDQDLTDNIVHLVLARTPNAGKGTKGLSLFMVPKYEFDVGGALGARNGAKVLRIEEKMGIHGSSTCVLGLGGDLPCRGVLLGQENQGIELMFLMMNEARIGVAVQGHAMAAAAYNYARGYAQERIQGQSIREARSQDAPSVAIVQHPDVRRMLMTQKVYAEAMRSLLLRMALVVDREHASEDPAERERLRGRIDLLTPILKATCTDLGFEVAVGAVQVYGGYGYIGEYPVEQLVRDVKICSIYEGTNGIQAMDLVGRKLRIGGGALFIDWMQEAQGRLAAAGEAGLGGPAEAIGKAVQLLAASAMHLAGLGKARKVEAAMMQAVPFTRMFGLVLLGVECIEQALVAARLRQTRGDEPHLIGKQRNLEFFVAALLPQAIALGKSIQSNDESALDPALFV
ncbi:acyl-CoA dehydrogenase [Nannocystis punicea]|uniref:Acyl-CoA dehydrogenase n=1 Tax=Nannocystis punicea TaxID=2995304 RepID=A0ABY7HFJ4_9BACT|nr:acyl-CoA dehydrogenase [Nannocystis poenicansa]WAS97862.1 acyl-CoA dehydrogenase [Nannocystis poenicansa]